MIPITKPEPKPSPLIPRCENKGCGIVRNEYNLNHYNIIDGEKVLQFIEDKDQPEFHWCTKCGSCIGIATFKALNLQLEPKFGRIRGKEQEKDMFVPADVDSPKAKPFTYTQTQQVTTNNTTLTPQIYTPDVTYSEADYYEMMMPY